MGFQDKMPRKYLRGRSTRIKRRTHYRRRRYVRKSRAPKSKAYAPLGTIHAANLRYCDNQTIDCGAGVSGDYVFSANGMYDPNITGVGHQPSGFDQMMTFFDHYCVTGSKCTVRAASTVTAPFYVGIALRDDNVPLLGVSLQTLFEQAGIVFKLCNYGDSSRPVTVWRNFSMRKFMRGAKVGEAGYRGDAASNPTEQAYFHVIVCPAAGEDLAAQRILVQLDYHAVFTEAKPLATS